MDPLPVARGAWLPIDAAAELLQLDAATIRRWVAEGSLEVRVVEGVEFVRLHELRAAVDGEPSQPGDEDLSARP